MNTHRIVRRRIVRRRDGSKHLDLTVAAAPGAPLLASALAALAETAERLTAEDGAK